MEMTKEDVEILSKYYDKMFQIVSNKSCSTLSSEMKQTVIRLLEKYDRMSGCSKCNSNIPRIMLEGCRMFKENEYLLRADNEEVIAKKVKKQRNANAK